MREFFITSAVTIIVCPAKLTGKGRFFQNPETRHGPRCPPEMGKSFKLFLENNSFMQINFYYLATGPWKLTDKNCWDECNHRGGKCLICGESGYCCRNEDHPTWNGDCPTGAIKAALNDRHQCVAPKQGSL